MSSKEYKLVRISNTNTKYLKFEICGLSIGYYLEMPANPTMYDCRYSIKGSIYSCSLRSDEVALMAACFPGTRIGKHSLKRLLGYLNYPSRSLVLQDIIDKILKGEVINICSYCKQECEHITFHERYDDTKLCIKCLMTWELNKDSRIKYSSFLFRNGKLSTFLDNLSNDEPLVYIADVPIKIDAHYSKFKSALDIMFELNDEFKRVHKPIYRSLKENKGQ